MKGFLKFSKETSFASLAVMVITVMMFTMADHCDNILKLLFFILGYIGMDIYAYMMYKSNKNK